MSAKKTIAPTPEADRVQALEYLVEKLSLDGEYLAKVAEKLQEAINAADTAEEALDEAETNEQIQAAQSALTAAEEDRSEYWNAVQSAIHDFRKRTASVSALPAAPTLRPQVSIVMCPICESADRTYWPQEPFAHFRLNEGWNTWEEVTTAAKNEPGVVAAYRLPVPNTPSPTK